ncbi:hypothetical protein [Isobaculum melis]|nr:hypothetical protein [Isobaculum melis]
MSKKISFLFCCIGFIVFTLPFFGQPVFAEETGKIYPSEEAAVQAEMAALENRIETPGTYPILLRFKKDEKVIQTTIYCTIRGKNTVISDGVAIDANDGVVTIEQIEQLSKADWISLTNAHAWKISDGQPLTVKAVETQAVKKKVGRYPISFQTIEGVQTTVMITVVEDVSAMYHKNNAGNWFEKIMDYSKEPLDYFDRLFLTLIRFTLLFLLLLPLFALVIQYFFATKLVKQVVALVKK